MLATELNVLYESNQLADHSIIRINRYQSPLTSNTRKLNNDYEMTAGNDTIIRECLGDTQIPSIKYTFIPINDIEAMEPGTYLDIIAVVKWSGDFVNFVSKAGKELTKREVMLVDQSAAAITLTLWGEEAKNFDGSDQPVLLVKGAKLGEFSGGKNLSGGAYINLNPDIPEGHKLREWSDNGGSKGKTKMLSLKSLGNMSTEWVNFYESEKKKLGSGDKPDYYQVMGFIHNIRSTNAFYKACSTPPDCNKKVRLRKWNISLRKMPNGNFKLQVSIVNQRKFKKNHLNNFKLKVNFL